MNQTPFRLLVVEDELLVAMVVESMLEGSGCTIVGPVNHLAAALVAAERNDFDAALLDVNLNGRLVFPVADLLADRAMPFIFVTGYGSSGIPSRHADRPVLIKPYREADLWAALEILKKMAPA